MNFGFLQDIIDDTHYVLGKKTKLPPLVLQPNGQWDRYLPKYEIQDDGYETSGCTVWGWQNLIEILMERVFNQKDNYSERFTYIRAGVTLRGASPHFVAENIRKEGLLPAHKLKNPPTYDEFRNPSAITPSLIARAQNWLHKYVFMHDWLWVTPPNKNDRTRLLKAALVYSPVGVSVTAWYKGEDGTYIDNGLPNGHWCVIYGWNDKGWKVFDSYDHTRKILSYDHNIQYAKRAYIGRAKRENWLVELFTSLKKLFV